MIFKMIESSVIIRANAFRGVDVMSLLHKMNHAAVHLRQI